MFLDPGCMSGLDTPFIALVESTVPDDVPLKTAQNPEVKLYLQRSFILPTLQEPNRQKKRVNHSIRTAKYVDVSTNVTNCYGWREPTSRDVGAAFGTLG